LLGVQWAELYRRAKTQETVALLLTQQYEMAKIREAKELPTVRILDQAQAPEKKSFPPRLLIIILGTLLSIAGACVWLDSRRKWQRIDPDDPRKALLLEIGEGMRRRAFGSASREAADADGENHFSRRFWRARENGRNGSHSS
jgi:hypothetical protein